MGRVDQLLERRRRAAEAARPHRPRVVSRSVGASGATATISGHPAASPGGLRTRPTAKRSAEHPSSTRSSCKEKLNPGLSQPPKFNIENCYGDQRVGVDEALLSTYCPAAIHGVSHAVQVVHRTPRALFQSVNLPTQELIRFSTTEAMCAAPSTIVKKLTEAARIIATPPSNRR